MEHWRVIMLGDRGTGKTSVAVQFTMKIFIEIYDPTIEDSYSKQIVVDSSHCYIEVVENSGQEDLSIFHDQYLNKGKGFILVYSIASRQSFERLEAFRQTLRRVKFPSPPLLILVGNKCDQTDQRQVSIEEGKSLATQWGCEFMETSARTGENVDGLFTHLVRALRLVRDGTVLLSEGTPGPLPERPKRQFWQVQRTKPRLSSCVIV